METIIATIKPVHLGNIRRGVKLYEIRKTCPKEIPFRVLCCESGSGGKIKAEFVVDYAEQQHTIDVPQMVEESCVSHAEAFEYSRDQRVYFWHITDMVDYCNTKGRKVRNISEFGLKRPPQSWQYVKDNAERAEEDG